MTGRVDAVLDAINNDEKLLTKCDDVGRNCFWHAAAMGHSELINSLCDLAEKKHIPGTSGLLCKDNHRGTALHAAVLGGCGIKLKKSSDEVDEIIKIKLNNLYHDKYVLEISPYISIIQTIYNRAPDCCWGRGRRGRMGSESRSILESRGGVDNNTAVELASICSKNYFIAVLLLTQIQLNSVMKSELRNEFGTLLQLHHPDNNINIIDIIKQSKATILWNESPDSTSAISIFNTSGFFDVIPEKGFSHTDSAFYFAIQHQHVETAEFLLYAGANPNRVINKKTILRLCCEQGYIEGCRLVINWGGRLLPSEERNLKLTATAEIETLLSTLKDKDRVLLTEASFSELNELVRMIRQKNYIENKKTTHRVWDLFETLQCALAGAPQYGNEFDWNAICKYTSAMLLSDVLHCFYYTPSVEELQNTEIVDKSFSLGSVNEVFFQKLANRTDGVVLRVLESLITKQFQNDESISKKAFENSVKRRQKTSENNSQRPHPYSNSSSYLVLVVLSTVAVITACDTSREVGDHVMIIRPVPLSSATPGTRGIVTSVVRIKAVVELQITFSQPDLMTYFYPSSHVKLLWRKSWNRRNESPGSRRPSRRRSVLCNVSVELSRSNLFPYSNQLITSICSTREYQNLVIQIQNLPIEPPPPPPPQTVDKNTTDGCCSNCVMS